MKIHQLPAQLALLLFFGLLPGQAKAGNESALVGSWVRPDGGYRLQVTAVKNDGTAEVAYFNPKSIHVAKATVSTKDGLPALFVLFDDENYHGSKYDLVMKDGKLVGPYFQASSGQTYNVFFEREPSQ